jgi:hypothetical protein
LRNRNALKEAGFEVVGQARREVGAVVTDCKRKIYDARQRLGTTPGSPAWITAQA